MKLKELMGKASSNNFLEAEHARGILTDHTLNTYMDLVEALEEMGRLSNIVRGSEDEHEFNQFLDDVDGLTTQALERANNVEEKV